jgi:hypothetical protein
MHIIDATNIIDFTKSLFIDLLDGDKGTFLIKSYKEYLETNKTRKQLLTPQKLVILEELGIFTTPFDTSIIINEKVKVELEENNITGIDIKPYTYFEVI